MVKGARRPKWSLKVIKKMGVRGTGLHRVSGPYGLGMRKGASGFEVSWRVRRTQQLVTRLIMGMIQLLYGL